MERALIIAAGGRGTRLGTSGGKLLHPVDGRPMVEHLLELYERVVDRIIIVVNPATAEAVDRGEPASRYDVEWSVQHEPTGMLDAILTPLAMLRQMNPRFVWVTWCDQIAVTGETVTELSRRTSASADAAIVFPTLLQRLPYIHWVRDTRGRLVDVLQRREGDRMPDEGECDIGLFALSSGTYLEELRTYEAIAPPGRRTAERNFLPFVPWVAGRASVETFPARDAIEAVGINTRDDLLKVEHYLRSRRRGQE